jgi:sugar phosphate isomerase/epimerase
MKKTVTLWVFFLLGMSLSCFAADKPNSKFKGVQVGTITYSYRSMPDQSLQSILDYVVESGVSSVELMGGEVEAYLGCPKGADAETVRKWRTSLSMDKFKEIRKMFHAKGVKIHILKLGDPKWSDEEIDYAFKACKALGAKGITMEVSEETAKRMAPFADKHKSYVILHNHGQPGNPDFSFDGLLACGPRVMLNFDVGHYFGATGVHPNELIKRLHNRIISIHVKDKTAKSAADPDKNRPFGQGDTPVDEILQLIQKEKWPIFCDIELEYEIPSDSDAAKEVMKCVKFCEAALTDK